MMYLYSFALHKPEELGLSQGGLWPILQFAKERPALSKEEEAAQEEADGRSEKPLCGDHSEHQGHLPPGSAGLHPCLFGLTS